MKYINALISIVILLVVACSNQTDPNYNNDYQSINSAELKDAIALADGWKFTQPKITSYMTTTQLHIEFPDGRTVVKDLPSDQMYVAVAPYMTKTHTCSTHYLSSCQGELTNKSFEITAVDTKGNKYYSGSIATMSNGFFELWLPRNETITIDISYDGKNAEEILTTDGSSRTCITTAYLH
jgi:hypothetical protein